MAAEQTKSIEWSTFGNVGSSLDIDLHSGGVFLKNIVTATPNDGKYSWSIPTDVEPGTQYSIKIISSGSPIFDFSDSYFSIGLDALNFS